jgi:hypothetical protein
MNPKPFSELNHFTLPFFMKKILLLAYTPKPCVNSPNYNVIALPSFPHPNIG